MIQEEEYKVSFSPDNKSVKVKRGTTLLDAAIAAGVYVNSICGGDGICGKCRLIVKKGEVHSEPTVLLNREEIQKGYVLACKTTVRGNVEVEIPLESRIEGKQIVDEDARRFRRLYGAGVGEAALFTHSPLATKLHFKLGPPSLQDNLGDLQRLYREIRKKQKVPIMQTGLANLKKLGKLLRESDWDITVTLGKRNGTTEVVQIEPGNTADRNYGIAVDVGTTTIVSHLIDLNTEQTVDAQATYNSQISYGEDVISRIIYAQEKNGGLEKLSQAVTDNINNLISNSVADKGVKLHDVTAVILAGNTTMTHLLLGLDPTFIRRDPYIPSATSVPVIRAAEVGIKINPRGLLACLPGVSSYVGGDITAGVLASGIADTDSISMLIDIGTNGEAVLGNKDWLVCCSCSAGPAFEGSGVKYGMRATRGAIERVNITPPPDCDVDCATIGGAKPRGICGSGLIDCISELLRVGSIDRSGRFDEAFSCPRLRRNEDGEQEFVLVWASETDIGKDIVITQADISNLIRAKAAIYAGASILLNSMGFAFNDIDYIYIAGGFGNYLDIRKAVLIGLLPDIPLEKFQFIGNGSINGAKMCLLSYDAYARADEIAKKMTYFELSADNRFMEEYVSAMFLPHTDLDLFPSVRKRLGI